MDLSVLGRWSGHKCSFQEKNMGITLHGWNISLSIWGRWVWLSQKTMLVLQELVMQQSGTSSNGKRLEGQNELLVHQQPDSRCLHIDIEKGNVYQNSKLQKAYWTLKRTCFLKRVLQQWTSGKEHSRRIAGHWQYGNLDSCVKENWLQKAES